MKNALLIGTVGLALTVVAGCGGSGEEPEIAAAESTGSTDIVDKVADTKSLDVASDFDFDTARGIDIEFDLESARGMEASVSICTSYDVDGDAYDVDYESCAVRGPMLDGVFSHSMEITNEFDSVVAVVWFQDSTMVPLHREFSIEDSVAASGARGIRAANGQRRVIVWE